MTAEQPVRAAQAGPAESEKRGVATVVEPVAPYRTTAKSPVTRLRGTDVFEPPYVSLLAQPSETSMLEYELRDAPNAQVPKSAVDTPAVSDVESLAPDVA